LTAPIVPATVKESGFDIDLVAAVVMNIAPIMEREVIIRRLASTCSCQEYSPDMPLRDVIWG